MAEVKGNIGPGVGEGCFRVLGKRAGGGGNVRFEINGATELITLDP